MPEVVRGFYIYQKHKPTDTGFFRDVGHLQTS